MGDIVAGIALLIIALVLGLAYFFIARRLKTTGRFSTLVNMLVIFGALLGLVTEVYRPALYFFIVQAVAGILYFRYRRLGTVLLILTFLLQVPILHGINYAYSCQTLLSLRLDLSIPKTFDVEPGSYLFYAYTEEHQLREAFSWGLNLFPLLLILFYLRAAFKSRVVSRENNF